MGDLGIGRQPFVDAITELAGSVYSFHERFNIGMVDVRDDEATLEALRQRLSLLIEEAGEHAHELNRGNVEAAISEVVDTAYIALGTVLRLAEPGRDACLAVARKNDAKSLTTHGARSGTGKVVAREA